MQLELYTCSATSYFVPYRQFSVVYEYDGELAGASLAAPCTATHSLNMNQRVITLEVGV